MPIRITRVSSHELTSSTSPTAKEIEIRKPSHDLTEDNLNRLQESLEKDEDDALWEVYGVHGLRSNGGHYKSITQESVADWVSNVNASQPSRFARSGEHSNAVDSERVDQETAKNYTEMEKHRTKKSAMPNTFFQWLVNLGFPLPRCSST